jgi:CHAD domain-containing protein
MFGGKRAWAIEHFGEDAGPRAEALFEKLRNPMDRYGSLTGLGAALPALTNALLDSDLEVRSSATNASKLIDAEEFIDRRGWSRVIE